MYRYREFGLAACLLLGLAACGGGGNGSSADEASGYAEPVLVAEIPSVLAVAAGWWHTCAVDDSGQAWCWGTNEYGALGCTTDTGVLPDSDIPYVNTPCPVTSGTPPMVLDSIASATAETCGLDGSGSAICWGYGISSEPVTQPIGPTPVTTSEHFSLLRAPMGSPGMCALTPTGTRYCWGAGATTAERLVAELQDDGGLNFTDIALSQEWGCGVTVDVEAWCWGSNWFGQLGAGTVGQFEGPLESAVPVKVVGDRPYAAIAAGLMHACALDAEGAAWCWGHIPGDLAYGSPQPVPGERRFASICAGGQFTCGLGSDGSAWCWGLGPFGELGNGSYDDSLVPVPVTGGLLFSTLAPGGTHVCGITTDRRLYCWGNNEFGQLGRP